MWIILGPSYVPIISLLLKGGWSSECIDCVFDNSSVTCVPLRDQDSFPSAPRGSGKEDGSYYSRVI